MESLQSTGVKAAIVAVVSVILITSDSGKADFAFGNPTSLGPAINSPAIDAHPSVSTDGLSLYFYSDRSGGHGGRDIWIARRTTTNDDWSILENPGAPINTVHRDSGPGISSDGLTLFFDSDRPGGEGGPDLWVTTRQTVDDDPI